MKKSVATKSRLAQYLALSLTVAVLFLGRSNALAENAPGRSSTTVNFQEPGPAGATTPQVLGYFGGLLLAAFMVRTHARAVLKKSARM